MRSKLFSIRGTLALVSSSSSSSEASNNLSRSDIFAVKSLECVKETLEVDPGVRAGDGKNGEGERAIEPPRVEGEVTDCICSESATEWSFLDGLRFCLTGAGFILVTGGGEDRISSLTFVELFDAFRRLSLVGGESIDPFSTMSAFGEYNEPCTFLGRPGPRFACACGWC